ncbi:jg10156 [Pararge aegeria aegeria]|uniref:Jg10156 protein n=1 Tax=Pararge aegeria aegeria TaxID=348720 RepID=A0A8S4RCL3_9NEOP|nr:jg10156 [Pararge aegeria aegeria]
MPGQCTCDEQRTTVAWMLRDLIGRARQCKSGKRLSDSSELAMLSQVRASSEFRRASVLWCDAAQLAGSRSRLSPLLIYHLL